MVAAGHGVDAAEVTRWHLIGMFAPSFITGGLATRYGVRRILMARLVLSAISLGIALSGPGLLLFMGVMSPTGSISVVTTAKVDRPMAITGAHLGASASMRIFSVVPCGIVASPFCGCGDMAGRSGAINGLFVEGLGMKWTQ